MIKRIALTIAPPFWPKLPPLSLVCLGSYLLAKGHDAELIDLNNYFYDPAAEQLKQQWLKSIDPDLEENMFSLLEDKYPDELREMIASLTKFDSIGFSCYQSNLKTTLRLVSLLKKTKPELEIILGGPQITCSYLSDQNSFSLKAFPGVDFLVVGEGEKALDDYIKGIVPDKKISLFSELENLDDHNPLLAYSRIKLSDYPRKKTVSLLFSRGCKRKCAFCSERLLYKNIRFRSVASIIEEISYHRKNGIEFFVFHDSMLNMDLVRLEELCEAIISNFGKVNWEAQMGIRTDMPDKLLSKIKQSGCYNLFIGLESGSENTLRKMRKGFTPEIAVRFFKQLKQAELYFGVSLIVGFAGESEAETAESLDFLIQNKAIIPKIEQVNPYVYYAGNDVKLKFSCEREQETEQRTVGFIKALKSAGFRMTNAFLNNLV